MVSIHTPTQGVTSLQRDNQKDCSGFNPHTHAGCDWYVYYDRRLRKRFQSTHPRRVWLEVGGEAFNITMFQSTHPRRVWL